MPEQKMPLFGTEAEVTDVPILKSTEPWYEYDLEDGSSLRVKWVPTSIIRMDGQYNADDTPLYLILATPVVSVVNSPDGLRQKK